MPFIKINKRLEKILIICYNNYNKSGDYEKNTNCTFSFTNNRMYNR